jgi:hypothetical protein
MTTRKNEYTDTVRDLKALLRSEVGDEKRKALEANLDKMSAQIERQRDQIARVDVLFERVDGLVWVVRAVLVATICEVISGVAIWAMTHGSAGK